MEEGIRLHAELVSAAAASFIIPVIMKFNIAEKILESPKTSVELSEGTSVNPERLQRYLVFLETHNLFSLDQSTGKWSSTARTAAITGDFHRSIWRWHCCPFSIEPWLHTEELLCSTKTSQEIRGRPHAFEDIKSHPEALDLFQVCMAETTKATSVHILNSIDLTGIAKVLDVGGGNGSFALELARANPHVVAGSFDRPEVLELAVKNIEEKGLSERVQAFGGSFLEKIQEGFDAITLKHIIHDWPDDGCLQILRTCRAALATGSKLFIIDAVIDRTSPLYKMQITADISLLTMFGSKERTQAEFDVLLSQTGFRIEKVMSSALEGVVIAVAI